MTAGVGALLAAAVPSMLMCCLSLWGYEAGGFPAGLLGEVELGTQIPGGFPVGQCASGNRPRCWKHRAGQTVCQDLLMCTVCETDQEKAQVKASCPADPRAPKVTPEQRAPDPSQSGSASGGVVLTVRQLAVRRGLALLLVSLILAAGVLTNELLVTFLQLT